MGSCHDHLHEGGGDCQLAVGVHASVAVLCPPEMPQEPFLIQVHLSHLQDYLFAELLIIR